MSDFSRYTLVAVAVVVIVGVIGFYMYGGDTGTTTGSTPTQQQSPATPK
jgi:hypothetical protein